MKVWQYFAETISSRLILLVLATTSPYTTAMKASKTSKNNVPSFIKKLFIYSLGVFYLATVFQNLVYYTMNNMVGFVEIAQAILMSTPLIVALIVHLTRTDRVFTRDSIFVTLVTTLALMMVYIAFSMILSPMLLSVAFENALGPEIATMVGDNYDQIQFVSQLVILAPIVVGFWVFAAKARKRGEW